uniref:Uncharacterized protein n=1 Tax=Anguilla anguilla TaxID=7936 RepID=A0A0E9RJE5_ANGAN
MLNMADMSYSTPTQPDSLPNPLWIFLEEFTFQAFQVCRV